MVPLIICVVPLFVLWSIKKVIFKQKKVYSIKDKVVLITGASSGLGEACAYKFVEAGAKVILSARNVEKLNQIKDDIISKFGKDGCQEPVVLRIDLNDIESISRAARIALDQFGHIDILVNNAGLSYRGNILQTEMSVHNHLMRVNYFGPLALTKCMLPSMMERRQGHVVAVSSVQGKISIPFRSAYTASKHAFDAFFNCLRAEVADSNIHVTVVSPGYIRTNLSINATTGDGRQYGTLDQTTAGGMEPKAVAADILSAIERRIEDLVIADLKSNIGIVLNTLFPSLFYRLMKRRARKEKESNEKND